VVKYACDPSQPCLAPYYLGGSGDDEGDANLVYGSVSPVITGGTKYHISFPLAHALPGANAEARTSLRHGASTAMGPDWPGPRISAGVGDDLWQPRSRWIVPVTYT